MKRPVYIYNKTSIKRNILTIKQNTSGNKSGLMTYQHPCTVFIYIFSAFYFSFWDYSLSFLRVLHYFVLPSISYVVLMDDMILWK